MNSQPSLSRDDIVRLDKSRVWHPYTAMDVYIDEVDPFVIHRAQGPFLFDLDGRRYIDANASWWLAALGHNHPRLIAAAQRQMNELCHCSLAGTIHPQAAMLADELLHVAPKDMARVFFSDDGSTAVESAIKMAVQFFAQHPDTQRKRRFIALDGAFHGETVGASSLGGVEIFRRPFAGVLFDCVRVPSPADHAGHARAFDAIAQALEHQADQIVAVVIEPMVQGAAGMQVYDAGFLRDLRALCTRQRVFLIADEVFTGYGRTGRMWACDHAGITPDILCTAKGFSGGMIPMAATITTEEVFNGFRGGRDRAFLYGHSYGGNPIGAAIAREVLAIFRDEPIIEEAHRKGQRISQAFEAMKDIPGVSSPRSLGMIGALDLHINRAGPAAGHESVETESDLDNGYLSDAGWRVFEQARARGAYLRPLGETIYICPPLTIADDVLDELLGIVRESIEAAAL